MQNLFRNLPAAIHEELVQVLAADANVRVERIVSQGQSSPAGFWYDQDEREWVVVLQGSAVLRLADPEETVTMQAGDWLDIPAHRRHRVEQTSPHEPTIWLAVFWKEKRDA